VCLTALCGGGPVRWPAPSLSRCEDVRVPYTVETAKELAAAVARTPEMLESLVRARPPVPGGRVQMTSGMTDQRSVGVILWQQRESDIARGIRFPLEEVLKITEGDVPAGVPEVPEDPASPFVRGFGNPQWLYRWVRASAGARRSSRSKERTRARSWARYRDAVAPTAIAEWNVLVRRWADAYAPVRAAPPITSDPDVVPVALTL